MKESTSDAPVAKGGKKGSDKKKKKSEGEPRANKCTVAALLSQFKREQPTSEPIGEPECQPPSAQPTVMPISTPQPDSPICQTVDAEKPSERKSTSSKKKSLVTAAAMRKNGNKLRDYFDASIDAAIERAEAVWSESPLAADGGEESTIGADNMKALPETAKRSGKLAASKGGVKKRRGDFIDSLIEREVSVATKKFKVAASSFEPFSNDLNVDYSNQSQLVFEITCEDGLRVISYDINRNFPSSR